MKDYGKANEMKPTRLVYCNKCNKIIEQYPYYTVIIRTGEYQHKPTYSICSECLSIPPNTSKRKVKHG